VGEQPATGPRVRSVLALGSNLGDRLGHLQAALDLLAAHVQVLAVSPVYETDPVGGPEQDSYLNAVVVVEGPPPRELLAVAHRVEAARDRVRRERWGPRTLDVDLVTSGDVVLDDPSCTLPHPRAAERAFVLVPWRDVEPTAVLPGRGAVADLLDGLGPEARGGVRARRDLALRVPGPALRTLDMPLRYPGASPAGPADPVAWSRR
jgi:2-amino-4-hydroxy-6-hydroxymethyldihydropteridine diphosphokinase